MEYVVKLDLPEEYEIKNDILNNLEYEVSKIEGGYAYDIASAHAKKLTEIYEKLSEIFPELFPWSCTKEPYLSMHLQTFGLTRREAVKARGEVTITGKVGVILSPGIVVISRLGIKYETIENGVIGSNGEAIVAIECQEAGIVGNCGIGDITTFEIANTDIYGVTNKEKIENGADIETVEMAKERMHEKASMRAHSGNKNDYILWAKSIAGVGKVTVWGAGEKEGIEAGQVEVRISDYNNCVASEELVKDVQNYIDTVKIINADVIVKSFNARNLTIAGEIKHSEDTQIEVIKEEFSRLLKQKLTEDNFILDGVLSIFKVANILFQVEGVIDYQNFTLNGITGSIQMLENEVVELQEVNFTEWI